MNENLHKKNWDLELAEAGQILRQRSLDDVIASIRTSGFTAQEIVEHLARDPARSYQEQ